MVKQTYSKQEMSGPTSRYAIARLEEVTTKTTTTQLRSGQPMPRPGTSRK
jgi:hypothetical protein